MSIERACSILKSKYHIVSDQSVSDLSHSVRHHWLSLDCKNILRHPNKNKIKETESENVEPQEQMSKVERNVDVEESARKVDKATEENESELSEDVPPVTLNLIKAKAIGSELQSHKVRCTELKETYDVAPGSSWGTLPDDLKK